MASVAFILLFYQTYFANLEFVHFVTCSLRFLILKRYISEHTGFSFLKICKARLQMTISLSFSLQIFFAEKLLAKTTRKTENFWIKSPMLTSISTIHIRWVPMLVGSVRNQPFLTPYKFQKFWNFSVKF